MRRGNVDLGPFSMQGRAGDTRLGESKRRRWDRTHDGVTRGFFGADNTSSNNAPGFSPLVLTDLLRAK